MVKNVLLARASFLLTLLPLLANAAPTRAPADLAVTTQDPTFGEQAGTSNNQADATLVGAGASSSSNDSSGRERCPICLEPLEDGEVDVTSCAHKFHKNCIDNWASSVHANNNRALTCPVCRSPLPSANENWCFLCGYPMVDEAQVRRVRCCSGRIHKNCLSRWIRITEHIYPGVQWIPCPLCLSDFEE